MKRHGFSLVEVMMVTTLVTSVSVVTYQGVQRGRQTECLNNLVQIYKAVDMFETDHGKLPAAAFFPATASDPKNLALLLKDYTSSGIFFCPSLPNDLRSRAITYLWNDSYSGKPSSGGSNTWLMTEMTAISSQISPPHPGDKGYSILFADGHAASGPRVDIQETPVKPLPAPEKKAAPEETNAVSREPAGKTARMELRFPAEVKAGMPATVTVLFLDEKGLKVTTGRGTLAVAVSDSSAKTVASVEVPAGLDGRVTFDVVFGKSGSQTISVKDRTTGLSATTGVRVIEQVLAGFSFQGVPEKAVRVGEPLHVSIATVGKTNDKVIFTGKAWFLDENGGMEPKEIVFDKGVWEGDIVLMKTVMHDTLLLYAGDIKAQSGGFSVVSGRPEKITMKMPEETTAGVPFTMNLAVGDAQQNVCEDFTGEMRLDVSDGKYRGPVRAVFTAEEKGRKQIELTLVSVGRQRVKVSAERLQGEQEISVNPGPFVRFTMDKIRTQTAGKPFQVLVKAEDSFGNRVKGYRLKDATGTLRVTQRDYSSGLWMESLVVTGAGKNNVIELEDGYGHIVKSDPFDVVPGPPEKLVVEGLSFIMSADTPHPVKLFVADKYDNIVEEYRGGISMLSSNEATRVNLPPEGPFPLTVTVIFSGTGLQTLDIKDPGNASLKAKIQVFVVPAGKP